MKKTPDVEKTVRNIRRHTRKIHYRRENQDCLRRTVNRPGNPGDPLV